MNSLRQAKVRSNIWKFYLFDILGAMLFALPIIVLFWQDNGLSLTQIMILQSLFAIAMVILEVPTGYLADIYGRKKVLIYSGFSLLLSVFLYSLGFNFVSFLIAEMFFALGHSLYSGTSSAFVYDTLTELKQEKKYNIVWGKAKYYGLLATAFSHIIGGFIGKINFRWTFYLSIPFYFLLIPLTLSMHEPRRHKMILEKNHWHKLSLIFKFSLLENIKLRWLMVFSGVIYAINSAGLWLYQPYFKLSGVDIIYFGFIFALFQIVAAFSSKYAHQIKNKLGTKASFIILVPIIFLGYLLTSKIIFLFSFVFIFLFQFVRGFSEPIFSDYVNQLTSSEMRATVLSVQSLIQRLLYAFLIPVIGWIADVYSILQALAISGFTALIGGSIILLILYKNKVI